MSSVKQLQVTGSTYNSVKLLCLASGTSNNSQTTLDTELPQQRQATPFLGINEAGQAQGPWQTQPM